MAAGLGTRLRPLTHEIPKPLVPVANRPIMEHILELLAGQEMREVVANLHWFGDTIRDRFGDGSELGIELTYSEEEKLLGTAGGVRNVRSFFGDDPFTVMAADALTDIDLQRPDAHPRAQRLDRDPGGQAGHRRPPSTGSSSRAPTARVQGFQEKPEPAEALSDLANCMIYVLEPEVFDHFPDKDEVDFALDVFPALLEADVPFGVHVTEDYWNDVGSLPEYLQGNLDVLTGAIDVAPAGELIDDGRRRRDCCRGVEVDGPVLLGEGAEVGEGAMLEGPLVIGPGATIGAGARVRESVLLPGAEVPPAGLLAGAIAGSAPALADSPTATGRGTSS